MAESKEDFSRDPDTGELSPEGEAERWAMELQAAKRKLKDWQDRADKIVDRYLDEREKGGENESRLNLWTANVDTQMALMYGKTPKSDVSRAFDDQDDDVARVAAIMLERNLDHEMESESDTFAEAMSTALEDRLIPGFGFASVRYEVEFEPAMDEIGNPILDDLGQPVEKKVWENVATDWHYWRDVLWSPCRTFKLARWLAWKTPMTRKAAISRFGEEIGRQLPLNSRTGKKGEADAVKSDPWGRVDVWEIWSKEDRKVYWYVEGFGKILDSKDDPIGLDGFFPFPRPLICRPTTRSFVPRPEFLIAQDLYNEIDRLTTRIALLEEAVRVAGVFDSASPELSRLLSDSGFNKLYPASNWSELSEKGGLKGKVDWFPLEQITSAISVLSDKRAEKIGLLQQVTGWSDIMRGQSNPGETLGAQKLKSAYGGVRIQRQQSEFAEFASGLKQIAAEIMCKHFDAATLMERSNLGSTPDAGLMQSAAELLKSGKARFRVQVKPESINMTDYAQLKQERGEAIQSLTGLVAAMTPLIQSGGAQAVEFTLKAGAWMLAGVQGGEGLEAEFDAFARKAAQAAAEPKPPPLPDPAVVKGQVDMQKMGMDLQSAQAKHQMDMQRIGMEVQSDRAKAAIRVQEAQATAPPPTVVVGGIPR